MGEGDPEMGTSSRSLKEMMETSLHISRGKKSLAQENSTKTLQWKQVLRAWRRWLVWLRIGTTVHEAGMCEQKIILSSEEILKVPATGSVTK